MLNAAEVWLRRLVLGDAPDEADKAAWDQIAGYINAPPSATPARGRQSAADAAAAAFGDEAAAFDAFVTAQGVR